MTRSNHNEADLKGARSLARTKPDSLGSSLASYRSPSSLACCATAAGRNGAEQSRRAESSVRTVGATSAFLFGLVVVVVIGVFGRALSRALPINKSEQLRVAHYVIAVRSTQLVGASESL